MPLKNGLDNSQEYIFYTSLISVNSKFGEKDVIVVAGDFEEHVGGSAGVYEDLHGGYGFGVRIRKGRNSGFLPQT